MSKPITNGTVWANLSGNQPASQLDTQMTALYGAVNDILTYSNGFDDSGSVNALAITISAPLTFSLVKYVCVQVKVASTNTGPATLNVNGGGATSIVNQAGSLLSGGELVAGRIAEFQYDGSAWQLLAAAAATAANGFTLRNRFINGDMTIDQRNEGASVNNLVGVGQTFSVDRFVGQGSLAAKFSMQREALAVAGVPYRYALKLTSLAATTPGVSDQYMVGQIIEGCNIADLMYGTAQGLTCSVSFWCKTSITGTYCCRIMNQAQNRSFVRTFSLTSGAWTFVILSFPGDTTGTWLSAPETIGIRMHIDLGSGSNLNTTADAWQAGAYNKVAGSAAWVGTNGATFEWTGVQLEAGPAATPFERRPFSVEYSLCQRYYEKSFPIGTAPVQNSGITADAAQFGQIVGATTGQPFQANYVTRKAYPATVVLYNTSAANAQARNLSRANDCSGTTPTQNGYQTFVISLTTSAGSAAGDRMAVHWAADAESYLW